MVKCLTAQKDVDAVDMVDMVDIVDGVDGGCAIVCSSSFSLPYVPRLQEDVVQALACRTFRAFSPLAALQLISLYNAPKKICVISVISG